MPPTNKVTSTLLMTPSDLPKPHKSRWVWFSFLSALAIVFFNSGEDASARLLAAGFLLLGWFAFNHDPLDPAAVSIGSTALKLSALAGLLGVGFVLAAAFVALRS